MKEALSPVSTCFEIADAAITQWRGRCLDLFARGELAVTKTLLVGSETTKIDPLNGQRFATLQQQIEQTALTTNQRALVTNAMSDWNVTLANRTFLAHGVSTVLLDRFDQWTVQFDYIATKQRQALPMRLSLSEFETQTFECDLKDAYGGLAQACGQLRNLATKPDKTRQCGPDSDP